VPVCLAASHIAYGSIRMEPVFMVLGQSAATAAAMALDAGAPVQDVDYATLRARLLADGQVLEWTGPVKSAAPHRDPAKLEGVVVDNAAAKVTGNWTASGATAGFVGADYLHDGAEGKGMKSVAFTATLPRAADYEIRIWYPAGPNRAEKVPVTVDLPDGPRTFVVDQRRITSDALDSYQSLGRFPLPAGGIRVTIGTAGTTGHVIADAVQFVEAPQPGR
jgi:hypothetical protein